MDKFMCLARMFTESGKAYLFRNTVLGIPHCALQDVRT